MAPYEISSEIAARLRGGSSAERAEGLKALCNLETQAAAGQELAEAVLQSRTDNLTSNLLAGDYAMLLALARKVLGTERGSDGRQTDKATD